MVATSEASRFAICGSAGTTMLSVVGPIDVIAISSSSRPHGFASAVVGGWAAECFGVVHARLLRVIPGARSATRIHPRMISGV